VWRDMLATARRRGVALMVVALTLGFSALGGCEYVAYLGNYEQADAAIPDAGDGGCTCGTKCCPAGEACLDAEGDGVCSNDIVEVSAGGETSCAVLANGTLSCWGGNQYGSAGVGATGNDVCTADGQHVACRVKPVPVEGLTDVAHVSAGRQFVCAIKRDNSVWCWGRNDTGVLGHDPGGAGDGTCTENLDGGASAPCNATPQQVPNLSAQEVTAGTVHACAVQMDGSVACWGSNESGLLGNRDVVGATSIPHRVTSLPPSMHVATSHSNRHTCAVTSQNGGVWCWGFDAAGELGHPAVLDKDCGGHCTFTPIPVSTPIDQGDASISQPFDGVTEVRPAYTFTCALRADGTVWCWGSDDFGALGSDPPDGGVQRSPIQIQALPGASSLDARFEHACALANTGQIWCWGANILGSLGTGSIDGEPCKSASSCSHRPKATGVNAIGISTGMATSFALSADHRTISAWGDNEGARLAHSPGDNGDLLNCGDNRHSVCNPIPHAVTPFPAP